ncbi:DUF7519 family protein [Haloarchaeobius iranensis]|uniref:Uncharacterized protein n=1 Tax=Haloarchaeobius iranensis TaxID=996166 RepID=A0A1G9X357_9EURY|nr:hypothetical protein [Haloarchaeobius iranensis]SDM91158.1 hypothetical protein SAMN05192554_109128 [Haloarchaeobius iranensis]
MSLPSPDRGERNGSSPTGGTPAVLLALVAALAATFVAAVTVPGTAIAVAGTAALGAGTVHDGRRTRLAGGALLLGAVAYGAYGGLPIPVVLGGTVAALVAIDGAERAVALDAQVPDAATARLVLRRTGTTLVVATVVAGLGYGAYRVGSGEAPAAAAALLLVGALLSAAALR